MKVETWPIEPVKPYPVLYESNPGKNDAMPLGTPRQPRRRMLRTIERRLSHLEELIPPALDLRRFAARVSEHARRCGVSPGSAWIAVIEDLNERELDLLLKDLAGELPARADDEDPEAIRTSAIELGFSAEDVELLVRHCGESE